MSSEEALAQADAKWHGMGMESRSEPPAWTVDAGCPTRRREARFAVR